jgi:hypothetical protein
MTKKLTGTFYDVITGEEMTRELTDEEYAALIESGWTPGEAEEASEE